MTDELIEELRKQIQNASSDAEAEEIVKRIYWMGYRSGKDDCDYCD